jgi:hypothetical protein
MSVSSGKGLVSALMSMPIRQKNALDRDNRAACALTAILNLTLILILRHPPSPWLNHRWSTEFALCVVHSSRIPDHIVANYEL